MSRRLVGLALLILWIAPGLPAATMDFGGEVVSVTRPVEGDEHARFTVRIDYIGYMSRGSHGKSTQPGVTDQRAVMDRGTACILDGRLVNAATFAGALRPGQWGQFYENVLLDLHTTPNFQWGEVVAHDAAERAISLRVHPTHKPHHLEANPPRRIEVGYDEQTRFELGGQSVEPAAALRKGHWIQIHPPRKQRVHVYSEAAAFDRGELLPHTDGQRGRANDLTARAILKGYQAADPTRVSKGGVALYVQRYLDGQWEKRTLNNGAAYYLDGKAAPVQIAVAPGRAAVLGHIRSNRAPHKVFVRSDDDGLDWRIATVRDGEMVLAAEDPRGQSTHERIVRIDGDAVVQLDGVPADATEALKVGRAVTVLPARKQRTIRAFAPQPPTEVVYRMSGEMRGEVDRPVRPDAPARFHLRFGHTLITPRATDRYVDATFVLDDGEVRDLKVFNGGSEDTYATADPEAEVAFDGERITGWVAADFTGGTLDGYGREGRYRIRFEGKVENNIVTASVKEVSVDGEAHDGHRVSAFGGTVDAVGDPQPGGPVIHRIHLDGATPDRQDALVLHLRREGDRWIDGAAIFRGNRYARPMSVDPIDLTLSESGLAGSVRIELAPVLIEGVNDPKEAVYHIEATRTDGAKPRFEGTYTGTLRIGGESATGE